LSGSNVRKYAAAISGFGVLLAPLSASASGAGARKEYITGNYRAALPLAQEAAEKGDASAMVVLGMMYHKGQGVPQKYDLALKYWHDAARKGNAKAQNNIGMAFQNGTGVGKDYAEAAKWYMLAAKKNDGLAYSNLGVLYKIGKGVEPDYKKSLEFLQRAERLLTNDLAADPMNAAAIRDDLAFVRGQIAEVSRLIAN
jgi:uncharacterized protein